MAGLLLSRRGWDVTIIEQHPLPRDKVCGECLSATGIEVLQRAGLLEDLYRMGAVRLGHALLHPVSGQATVMPLPRPCLGISRSAMDNQLLQAACNAGALLHQPARCERLFPDRRACRIRHLTTNQIQTVSADLLLLADGKAALLDPRPAPTCDLGVKAHFVNVKGPRDAVELFSLGGHYAGLNPIENGRWNLALSVPADRVRQFRGDFERLLTSICRDNPALAYRLGNAQRVSAWMAAPLPRFGIASERSPEWVIPIGNAAAAIEPIGGEGMGLALRSAEIAVEAICRAWDSGRVMRFAEIAEDFDRLWRTRSLACRLSAIAMSHPAVSDPALALLDANQPLQQAMLRFIGK